MPEDYIPGQKHSDIVEVKRKVGLEPSPPPQSDVQWNKGKQLVFINTESKVFCNSWCPKKDESNNCHDAGWYGQILSEVQKTQAAQDTPLQDLSEMCAENVSSLSLDQQLCRAWELQDLSLIPAL